MDRARAYAQGWDLPDLSASFPSLQIASLSAFARSAPLCACRTIAQLPNTWMQEPTAPPVVVMASQDALVLLRQSIAAEKPMVPVASPDSTDEAPLSSATHLLLPHPQPTALPLEAPTRFTVNDFKIPVDLRSIYFAWVNRDLTILDYNAAATRLNEELAATGSQTTVHKLTFVERVNLITWIEGGGESEYIKPLLGEKEPGSAAAEALQTSSQPAAVAARVGKGSLDPRLQVIYAGERKMGDRNSILRGHKLTVSTLIIPGGVPRGADGPTCLVLFSAC